MEDFKAKDFNFEEEYQKIKNSIKKPNILTCGATGVGKSSIINKLFGEELAKVAAGEPVTRGIQKYEREDMSIVLYDSEGYEIGSDKLQHFKENIINCIDLKKEEEIDEHIHLVWYCISAANKRITELDIETIKDIQNKGVKVGVLLTQIDSVDEEELEQLIEIIKSDIPEIPYFRLSIYDDEIPEEYLDWNELVEWSLKSLDEALRNGFIKSLDDCLDKKKKFINNTVIPGYGVAATAAAASPIPLSDSAMLIPIQTGMCMNILHIWGIDKCSGALESILSSTILSQAGKFIAKTLTGNLLKLIPGGGTVLGIGVNATVASSFTLALGYAISELSYKYIKLIKDGKDIAILDVFTNEAIINMINQYFKMSKKGVVNE